MPSPFPGMDPYLEDPAFWSDFHSTFINYWREAIADLLPENYDARLDERVVLEGPPRVRPKQIEPDVTVLRTDQPSPRPAAPAGVATLEPVTVPLPMLILDRSRQLSIKILRHPERTLVTVLELLSPSNKAGPDRAEYQAKRNGLFCRKVHLVELDLLLSGSRLPMDGPLPPGDFYAFVSRSERRPDCDVYAWGMRQPLPRLPVPLKAPDPDVWFDLGAVFATAYERGRYARWLEYGKPPRVPIRDEDRQWVLDRAQTMRR
jgi:hypothetical protein